MTHHRDAIPPEDEFELAAETAEEAAVEAAASPTALHPPEGLSEDEQNAWWMKNVYCGDKMPQVTLRACAGAVGIGALMAISNLYVGLKSGMYLGVTITAVALAFAMFKSLSAVLPGLRRRPLNMLENCTIMTSASASGSLSAGAMIAAIPALYLCTGQPMPIWQMMVWTLCIATLGCFLAVPLKRQLINVDRLPFPSGTATAETLRTLHATGAAAMQQAKALLLCGVFGILLKFWAEAGRWTWARSLGKFLPPSLIPLFPGARAATWMSRYCIGIEPSTIMIGAGAIIGLRVGLSLLAGVVVFFLILAPQLELHHVITIEPGPGAFKSIVAWTLWPAVSLMVAAGLTNFALRWRMIARAMREMTAIFSTRRKDQQRPVSAEVPMSWFVIGTGLTGTACVVAGIYFFHILWWMGVLGVLLAFVLSIVAARATGETDLTPLGAMGKITQLTFGAIDPGNMTTNLMTASITGGAACHSADLLSSLKTGYLIGANAKKQAFAQLFGIVVGVVVCVPVYAMLVRTPAFDPKTHDVMAEHVAADAKSAAHATPQHALNGKEHGGPAERADSSGTNLLSPQFPAPAAVIWYSVARVLAKGFKQLPPWSGLGMLIGGVLGIIIALLEEFLPKRFVKWIPSATGLGLGGVIYPPASIAMFFGSLIGAVWLKAHARSCNQYLIAGASGLIAGESLTGVGCNLAGIIWDSVCSLFGG